MTKEVINKYKTYKLNRNYKIINIGVLFIVFLTNKSV